MPKQFAGISHPIDCAGQSCIRTSPNHEAKKTRSGYEQEKQALHRWDRNFGDFKELKNSGPLDKRGAEIRIGIIYFLSANGSATI